MKSLKLYIHISLIFMSILTVYSCEKSATAKGNKENSETKTQPSTAPYTPTQQWNDYWYAGKAELTSYVLQQSRYGEIHEGTAVNIFVTEDFSKNKQVKLDNLPAAGDAKVSVLKLNQSLKFVTGIYPYSLMMSSFIPIDIYTYPDPLKITATMQEWCGNTYYQMNNRNNAFEIEQRSYFEQEGDINTSITKCITEDGLWNMIRLAPDKLPLGDNTVMPGALYLRLSHKPIEAVKANLSIKDAEGMKIYVIYFASLNRTLRITFNPTFPYQITGWEDTFPGLDGKVLTTTASLTKTIILDYWSKHTNADSTYRKELGLPVLWQ